MDEKRPAREASVILADLVARANELLTTGPAGEVTVERMRLCALIGLVMNVMMEVAEDPRRPPDDPSWPPSMPPSPDELQQAILKASSYFVALQELGEGKINPLFVAEKVSHRTFARSEIWRSRASIAIALDALVAANLSLEISAARLARTAGIEKLLNDNAGVATSIKNWRTRLKERPTGNPTGSGRWASWERKKREAPIDDPIMRQRWFMDYSEKILDIAKNDIAQIIPRSFRHTD